MKDVLRLRPLFQQHSSTWAGYDIDPEGHLGVPKGVQHPSGNRGRGLYASPTSAHGEGSAEGSHAAEGAAAVEGGDLSQAKGTGSRKLTSFTGLVGDVARTLASRAEAWHVVRGGATSPGSSPGPAGSPGQ